MSFLNRKLDNKTYDQQLVIQATLSNRKYVYGKLQPTIYFWKELTAVFAQAPMCLIPDTLVLNEKQSQLAWIYTNQEGKITKQTNINFKDFIYKLTSYSSPSQLVAILKRPIFSQNLVYSNDYKLLNSKYLLNQSQQQFGQKDNVICIQRFIKSNGSKSFLCRTVYCTQGNSQCYLITNSRNLLDKNQPQHKRYIVKPGDKSTIVKSKQGKNLQQTSKYLKEIVQYMVFFRGIHITQLVGDFIKDEMGNWWLINIKAFKTVQKAQKNIRPKDIVCTTEQFEKQRYQKTKLCRYCQRSYLQSELKYKMTMRMIIQVDKYLLHLGKQYNWLKRSDISNIDSHCLYQEHKVCERCFRIYTQIQELMQVQSKLLIKQGCQLIAYPKQLIFRQTNQQHLRLQAKNKQIHRINEDIPQVIQLGPNTNITTKNQCPVRSDQIINKMIRFRLIVFLNQIDQVVNVKQNCNYFLQFSLLNKKSRYKLNMRAVEQKIIPLNKLKIYYFFANSLQSLQQQYILSNAAFNLFIVTQHKESQERVTVGSLSLLFKDLITPISSKKDFYKFFHIENVPYGWGLEGSVGIIPSDGQVSTAKISFQKSQGQIYIPNQNYYFCEHLTQQWIDLIKTKNIKAQKQRTAFKQLKMSQVKQRQAEIKAKNSKRGYQQSSLGLSKRTGKEFYEEGDQQSFQKSQDIGAIYDENDLKWKKMLQRQILEYEQKLKNRVEKKKRKVIYKF